MRILLVLILFLVGCASTTERAHQYYEAGAYDEAIRLYEKALRNSPDDDDATLGLRKSRLKWIDQKLVSVRLLRLGGNTNQSLVVLNKILDAENQWGLFPAGAVAFTQEEESAYAAMHVRSEIEKELKAGKPLLAALKMRNHQGFFQSKRTDLGNKLNKDIRALGQSGCKLMKQRLKAEDYYFGLFAQKYCGYFGDKIPALKAQIQWRKQFLFKNAKFEFEGGNLSDEFKKIFENEVNEGLMDTAWFDSEAVNTLILKGGGKFKSTHDIENTTLVHSYTVQVPYTEYSTETKKVGKEKSESSGFFSVLGDVLSIAATLAGGSAGGRTEKDNGDGTISVTETKYRDEVRTAKYPAKIHEQQFTLAVWGRAQFLRENVDLILDEKFAHSATEHHNNMPNIQLRPEEARLVPESDWIKSQAAILKTQFEERSRRAWQNTYCQEGPIDGARKTSAEQFFRCLRGGTGALPQIYTNWFKESFGVSLAQAQDLVGNI